MKVKNKFLTKFFNSLAQKIKPEQGSTNKNTRIVLLLLLLLFSPSCMVKLEGEGLPLNLPSIGESYSSSNSEYFYVDLNTEAYNDESRPLYEMNTTEEFNNSEERDSRSNCEIEYIPVDDEEDPISSESLVCILDMPEWEFITNNLNIVVNFPGGMCKDVTISLPWHFNFPIQPGPTVRECPLGTGGDDSGQGYCDTTTNAYRECSGTPGCWEEEENLCRGQGLDGVNCCAGGRKNDGSEWVPDEGCFGGPATIANGYEFPAGEIISLPEDGLRQTIVLPNLTSINGALGSSRRENPPEFPPIYQTTSFPFANYLEILDVPAGEIEDIQENALPPFLQYPPDNSYSYAPRAFFEFKCIGQAGETLHEILLMIREWNTMEEFLNFYEAGGDEESDPNVKGDEGDDCPYEERQTGGYGRCNDLLDLEDCEPEDLIGRWCLGGYPMMNYSN